MNRQSATFIPHSRPTLGQAEMDAVRDVIASGRIAQGEGVETFEREFANYFGFANAVAVSSGTAALHLALLGLGIGRGDEVIIPAYVCTALLNAVHYVGATPVLADVDPETGNLTPDSLNNSATKNSRAIIVPHMFGLPADVDAVSDLGVPVIEDCAQAIGASTPQGPVGSVADISIFSFYATKVLTTGEGGMVVCRHRHMAERIKDLRSYDERAEYNTRYNYKLTDIQAALGRRQLNRLTEMLCRRLEMATFYNRAFSDADLFLPPAADGRIYFRYTLGIKSNLDEWLRRLAQLGIGCARPVYTPLNAYLQKDPAEYPGTLQAHRHLLSIPIYPSLGKPDLEKIVSSVRRVDASLR
jgi:dTDP-4-amino-4,6-dideoxygalactose transaminase